MDTEEDDEVDKDGLRTSEEQGDVDEKAKFVISFQNCNDPNSDSKQTSSLSVTCCFGLYTTTDQHPDLDLFYYLCTIAYHDTW